MGEHTPGPWVCNLDTKEVSLAIGETVAFAKDEMHTEDKPTEQDYANAWLITAAPDLLEAAKYALQWVMEVDPDVHPSLPTMLKAAIAKARGEAPNG